MQEEIQVDQNPISAQEKTKNWIKKNYILVIVVTFIFLSIIIFFVTGSRPTQLNNQPNNFSDIQTALELSTTPKIIEPNSTDILYSEDVDISTGVDKVNAVQLEFTYDPKAIMVIDIKPGPFFKEYQVLLKKIDSKNGRIYLSLAVPLKGNGVSGQGLLASIFFNKVKTASGQSAINFTNKTDVLAQGINHSVLKSTVSTLFNLN